MKYLSRIRHHGKLKNFDLPGFTVNFQLHGRRAGCPVVQAAKSASTRRRAVRAHRFQYRVITQGLDAGCDVAEGKTLLSAPSSTVCNPPFARISPFAFAGDVDQFTLQIFTSVLDGISQLNRRSLGVDAAKGQADGGVRLSDDDLASWQFQSFRGDDRDQIVDSLARIRGGVMDFDIAANIDGGHSVGPSASLIPISQSENQGSSFRGQRRRVRV